MTITEACDKYKEYLSNWYKKQSKNFSSVDLYWAKKEFIKLNPEFEKFEFDIYAGIETIPESYNPCGWCSSGCCRGDTIKCRGVYAIPVDWDRIRKLASLD